MSNIKKKIDNLVSQYSQEVVKKWKQRLPEEALVIDLFFERWLSYEDYLNTPAYIIDFWIQKISIDNKLYNQKSKWWTKK